MRDTIVIVDDEPLVQDYVKELIADFAEVSRELLPSHLIILTATTVAEARQLLSTIKDKCLVAIIDGQLPDGTGPHLIREMDSAIPWIGITGNTEAWKRNATLCGLEHSPTKLLPKPIDEKRLFCLIARSIKCDGCAIH